MKLRSEQNDLSRILPVGAKELGAKYRNVVESNSCLVIKLSRRSYSILGKLLRALLKKGWK